METNFYTAEKYRVFRVKRNVLLKSARLLFYFGLFIISISEVSAQTSPLSFTLIPTSNPEIQGPCRGAEQWNTGNVVNIPTQGTTSTPWDAYYRFQWYELETGNRTYNWSVFDFQINAAIDKGQHFSFGIMPICPGCGGPQVNGSLMGYPAFLHTLMQAESSKDWVTTQSDVWVPNWNSPSYLTAVENMVIDINNHLNTTSHNGVLYKDVINYIDIRSFGSWGEWHEAYVVNTMSEHPAGTAPTTATLKRIIDAYKNGFPNFQLIAMMAVFDGYYYANTWISPEIGVYALQTRNNKGLFGWRRDNWGDNADNYDPFLVTNTRGYGTLPQMKDSIMPRYKSAPIVGEPNNGANSVGSTHYADLANQVTKYHTASFGNGNIDFNATTDIASSDAFRYASKISGHRLQVEGGALTTTLSAGSPFTVTLNWRNAGLTPLYEDWNVVFELRNSGGSAVWSGTSNFNPHFFQPSASTSPITDNFTLPSSVPSGNYSMYLICRDPKGYRKPLPLAITGRNADGSYLLRSNITVGTGGPVNQAPTANAGPDQTIQLPASTVSLTGTGADADGTIASYAWTKLSGPAAGTITNPTTANTSITGLVQGVYVFTLTVTDNQGATGTNNIQVTVNAAAANQTPTANAGGDKTIQLPTSSVALTGTGTDVDGTISSYAWTKLSGPAAGTIATPATANTNITGLVQGVYVFTLTVTDNQGATATDNIQVTVNAAAVNQAPTANAGTDKTIQLPTSTVSLTGSGTDADGTIASYAWSKLSGPGAQSIVTPAIPNTNITGLLQGVYAFVLTVTDNLGATDRDTVQVTVNAAANQPPVADAGTDKTIQLPVSTVALTGSGTDADGTISSYAWTKLSGPAAGAIATPTTANTNITGLVQGVYVFTLTVTDNQGATGTNNIQVTVNAAAPVNQVPTANAGSDQTIQLPASSVSLTGSGTDADGTISSYAWTKLSGPAAGTIATPTTANTNVTGLVQGVYVFTLTVTDNQGATGTNNIQVTVNAAAPVNQVPTANAGSNQTIQLPASSVSLTGSGTDADGTVSSYAWSKLSGPAAGTIATPTTANTNITGLVQGVYVFTLTVTDNQGATGTDNIQVTVNAAAPVNQVPTANAGSDQTIQLPASTVSVTGTGADTDGTIASYAWTELSGPAAGTITNPATANTSITGLVQGVYVFILTVTDNQGASSTDNIQVTVNAATADIPPIAIAGTDMSITMPTNTANVNGSASTDPDGTISSFLWTKVGGPAQFAIANSAAMNTTVNNLTSGVYKFQLKVTDNAGVSSTDTVNITVNAVPNQPPVSIAGTDQTITLPTNSVSINGSASSDPDGSISAYLWAKLSGPAQFTMGNNTAASTIVNNLTAGVYTFQLRVTDNLGAIALDTVKIIVNSAPVNQLPVANAGADISITLPTNIANLNGSASSDADGTISAYTWSQVSGPNTATIASAAGVTTGVSGLLQGSYTFSLTVTDNSGATDLDSLTVIVNAAPNTKPIANAGKSGSITHPNKKTSLNGTLSTDPDGSITAYSWTEVSGPTTAVISGADSSVATADSLEVGVYNFQLAVTDNSGAISTSTVKITVTAANIPVANAGADQTIALPTNSVIIDGSGSSSPSGSIVSYAWTEKSGPSIISLSNTVQNTLNNLQAGVYVFNLVITDNNAATASDSVTITVIPAANKAPVANAGSGINLTLPTNSTSLDGSLSSDPDGTISSYGWTKVSGPNTPVITGANTATAGLSGLVAGQYVYQLTVTDNNGASSSAQVNIIVTAAANVPPVANAGPNQSITSPASSVILNGSASMDPDGTIVSYSWVTVSGPGSITINNSNTVTPSAVGLQTGGYVFELTVTDNNGATSKDQISVTVLPPSILPNQPPVANAGTNLTITAPDNIVDLNGTSSFDPDGTLTAFGWAQISGPSASVISGGNTSTATASQLIEGQYVFELTVADNNGATNTDRITVTVNPGVPKLNLPPVAYAGQSDTVLLPNDVYTLDAGESVDPDGTIQSYQWQQIGGPNTVSSSSMNSSQVTINNLQAGEYEFQVTVTDDAGATSTATMTLTVLQGGGGFTVDERLSVFPNPTHNMLHEKITSPIMGTVRIDVYDMNAKLVLSSQVEKTSEVIYNKIVVDQLAPGMYTIQVNIANRKTMVTKFIKY